MRISGRPHWWSRQLSATGFRPGWSRPTGTDDQRRRWLPRDQDSRRRGAFRVFYVATIGDAVYVLHCFEKKSQRTAKADLDLGKARYKQMQIIVKETGR
jgi:hypothetical protein